MKYWIITSLVGIILITGFLLEKNDAKFTETQKECADAILSLKALSIPTGNISEVTDNCIVGNQNGHKIYTFTDSQGQKLVVDPTTRIVNSFNQYGQPTLSVQRNNN